jgi:hypothetical protein
MKREIYVSTWEPGDDEERLEKVILEDDYGVIRVLTCEEAQDLAHRLMSAADYVLRGYK